MLPRGESRCGSLVTVIGEAGLGKSRLLYEFDQELERAGATVLRGRSRSYGSGSAYLPLIDVLRAGVLALPLGVIALALDEREREILKLRFGLDRGAPRTPEEAGEHLTPRDAVGPMAEPLFLPVAYPIQSGDHPPQQRARRARRVPQPGAENPTGGWRHAGGGVGVSVDHASATVEQGPVAVGRQIVAYSWVMVATSLLLVPVAAMGYVPPTTAAAQRRAASMSPMPRRRPGIWAQ